LYWENVSQRNVFDQKGKEPFRVAFFLAAVTEVGGYDDLVEKYFSAVAENR
jgi:hypothetical protein